jgi:hypothetical protein
MRALELGDLTDLASYANLRQEYRHAVIAHKKSRRMSVGDRVTLLFEDRETLRFQVQEMCFVEHIDDTDRVQDELDVYNELMPGKWELSATLFIEITDLTDIRAELDRLIGLDEQVSLRLGLGDDAEQVAADFDPKQLEEDRLSAVQYIRFQMDEAQARRFEDPTTRVAIRIEHPEYDRETELPLPVRESLAAGLRAEPKSLLAAGAARRAADPVVFEGSRVRVRKLTGSSSREHRVVEARAEESFDDALWSELVDVVRRTAEEISARHGRARIQADWDSEDGALRWQVVSVAEKSPPPPRKG